MSRIQDSAVRVFIAEDNPVLLQGLERALSASGYLVETAESGDAILSLLSSASHPPDLLLLDVMMPGKSGFEVAQAVKEDPRLKGVPVVLITAATEEVFPDEARRSGAVDLLIKPFRLDELVERIDRHVRRARSGDGPTGAKPSGSNPLVA